MIYYARIVKHNGIRIGIRGRVNLVKSLRIRVWIKPALPQTTITLILWRGSCHTISTPQVVANFNFRKELRKNRLQRSLNWNVRVLHFKNKQEKTFCSWISAVFMQKTFDSAHLNLLERDEVIETANGKILWPLRLPLTDKSEHH